MQSSTAKAALALAICLITATSAARADSVFTDIGHGTARVAKDTWHGTEAVTRTVVYSPVIAYQVARGERPLFPQDTATRDRRHREQIALGGHRAEGH
jgi:hypothetical protein